MMPDTFAAFILSHGRPNNVLTYKSLRSHGYTGKIYVIADNEDSQLAEYKKNFGDELIVFNKTEYAKHVDACDNYDKRNSVVYARNYNFKIARELGITHFIQLDDDYTAFGYTADNNRNYITKNFKIERLDSIFLAYLRFLDDTGAMTVAFIQGGDLIGGANGKFRQFHKKNKFMRKAMNSFFFRSSDDIEFRGRVNDDVNLYVEGSRRGGLCISPMRIRLCQPETQQNSGGCTEIYKDLGTYVKSFYSLMVAPSCVRITMMGTTHKRIHHEVKSAHAYPVIVDPIYRKNR